MDITVTNQKEIKFTDYATYKQTLDQELQQAAEGFVMIGYLLKQARDTDILQGSGYSNVNEFAQAEYGIDKSVVSRYIRINDKFSEDGNSPYLQEQYRRYGYAKLSLMLQLPEEINDQLTPEYTKAEIQSIKEAVDEEQEKTDIEVMLEDKPEWSDQEESLLMKVAKQIIHDDTDLYEALVEEVQKENSDLAGIMAPNGDAMYSIRIAGVGRMMLTFKDGSEDISLVNVRSGETSTYGLHELEHAYMELLMGVEQLKERWIQIFGEPYPEAAEQPEESKPKAKESKVKRLDKPKKPAKTPSAKPIPEEQHSKEMAQTEELQTEENEKSAEIPSMTPPEEQSLEPEEESDNPEVAPVQPESRIHEVKLSTDFWDDIRSGRKRFELRKNDREYQTGDRLVMREYANGNYTGRVIRTDIIYMLEDYPGLEEGYAILGIGRIEE